MAHRVIHDWDEHRFHRLIFDGAQMLPPVQSGYVITSDANGNFVWGPPGGTGGGGMAVVGIGANPPPDPVLGQLWWRTTDGNLFIWYDDGNSAQFVPAVPSSEGGGGGGSFWQYDVNTDFLTPLPTTATLALSSGEDILFLHSNYPTVTRQTGMSADDTLLTLTGATGGFRFQSADASAVYGMWTGPQGNLRVGDGIVPTERLEVTGGVQLGAAVTTKDGTIQYMSSHFWGRAGGQWLQLDISGGPPTGPAGGVLSGTYPNPGLAPGVINDSNITTISWSKITGAPTSYPPSGPAGGSLAGSTYPNPIIAPGAVNHSMLAVGALVGTTAISLASPTVSVPVAQWTTIGGFNLTTRGAAGGTSMVMLFSNHGVSVNSGSSGGGGGTIGLRWLRNGTVLIALQYFVFNASADRMPVPTLTHLDLAPSGTAHRYDFQLYTPNNATFFQGSGDVYGSFYGVEIG